MNAALRDSRGKMGVSRSHVRLDQRWGNVLVASFALRADRQGLGRVGFKMKRAEATANPVLVRLSDRAASGDFVANPNNQDACEKDEEGGENQPRELHSNHGA